MFRRAVAFAPAPSSVAAAAARRGFHSSCPPLRPTAGPAGGRITQDAQNDMPRLLNSVDGSGRRRGANSAAAADFAAAWRRSARRGVAGAVSVAGAITTVCVRRNNATPTRVGAASRQPHLEPAF